MKMVTPDRIEPIIGWRFWRLRPDGTSSPAAGYRLQSPVVPHGDWRPGTVFRSRCRRCDFSPSFGCRCGVYAFHPGPFFEDAVAAPRPSPGPINPLGGPCVVGQIRGWGRVVVHRKGWRAERAYPRNLALVCGACLVLDGALRFADLLGWDPEGGEAGSCAAHLLGWPADVFGTFTEAADAEGALCERYGVGRAPLLRPRAAR